jgi:uncharacterized membrane protein YdjX (TVP38/TMEM64 family)
MKRRYKGWLRLGIPVAIMIGFGVAAWQLGVFDPEDVAELRTAAGQEYLMPAFVALYSGVTAVGLPGSPLSYGAGVVFGFVRGAILVWIATLIGATAAYFLARGVLAKPARAFIDPYSDKLKKLEENDKPFWPILRLQLLPFVPFNAANFAAGVSRVSLWQFLLATAIGTVPVTLLETFVGDRLALGVRGGNRQALILGISIPLLLIAITYVPKLSRKLRGDGEDHEGDKGRTQIGAADRKSAARRQVDQR